MSTRSAAGGGLPAVKLVQYRGQVGRFGIFYRIHANRPARPLLGRNVENLEPALYLGEDGGVEGDDRDRAQAHERDNVDTTFFRRRGGDPIGIQNGEQLLAQLLDAGMLDLVDLGVKIAKGVAVEGFHQLPQALDVRFQVGDDEQVGPRVGKDVATRANEGLDDVQHLLGRDMLDLHYLYDELVALGRLLGGGQRAGNGRLGLGQRDLVDVIDVADLHRRQAVASQHLIEDGEEVLARNLARGADRHLPGDAGVDGIVYAQRIAQAVNHLADIGPLEVEHDRLVLGPSGLRGGRWCRACSRLRNARRLFPFPGRTALGLGQRRWCCSQQGKQRKQTNFLHTPSPLIRACPPITAAGASQDPPLAGRPVPVHLPVAARILASLRARASSRNRSILALISSAREVP